MANTIDRRTLLKLLAGAVVSPGLFGCQTSRTSIERLSVLLGLIGSEKQWLDSLTSVEQAELADALTGPLDEPVTDRAIELAAKVISRRSRLFAFVDYPGVPDYSSVCDGLIRE